MRSYHGKIEQRAHKKSGKVNNHNKSTWHLWLRKPQLQLVPRKCRDTNWTVTGACSVSSVLFGFSFSFTVSGQLQSANWALSVCQHFYAKVTELAFKLWRSQCEHHTGCTSLYHHGESSRYMATFLCCLEEPNTISVVCLDVCWVIDLRENVHVIEIFLLLGLSSFALVAQSLHHWATTS